MRRGICGSIRLALRNLPIFRTQLRAALRLDPDNFQFLAYTARVLAAESPDVVFTQWPIDRHRDHRAVSMLTLDAWCQGGGKFALYYYEVAEDTMMFSPAEYVDISSVESRRRAACYAHASQQPDKWYPKQVEITKARGLASRFPQAEAFLRHAESKPALLP